MAFDTLPSSVVLLIHAARRRDPGPLVHWCRLVRTGTTEKMEFILALAMAEHLHAKRRKTRKQGDVTRTLPTPKELTPVSRPEAAVNEPFPRHLR